jgi:hypothetical protein
MGGVVVGELRHDKYAYGNLLIPVRNEQLRLAAIDVIIHAPHAVVEQS